MSTSFHRDQGIESRSIISILKAGNIDAWKDGRAEGWWAMAGNSIFLLGCVYSAIQEIRKQNYRPHYSFG